MKTVQLTRPMLERLRERAIYHGLRGRDRWRPGEAVTADPDFRIESGAHLFAGHVLPLRLGAFSYSLSGFRPKVAVGRYCSFAQGVTWMGGPHPLEWASTSPVFYQRDGLFAGVDRFAEASPEFRALPPFDYQPPDPVTTVGNDVWIGDQAMIAPGVTVGDGAVIGARALVLEDVPPYAVVVGSPARVLRLRFPEDMVERFLALRWWRFAPDVIQALPAPQPERFLGELEAMIARQAPPEMTPTTLTWADLLSAGPAAGA